MTTSKKHKRKEGLPVIENRDDEELTRDAMVASEEILKKDWGSLEDSTFKNNNTDDGPWTAAQAGTKMSALVNALKASLPQAAFSMDISPWIANNGANWYPNFDMSLFTFINTSGGGTDAGNTKIRSNNSMTWAGVNQVTGKPILADTGYGAAGTPAGPDPIWDVPANINARIADGVISITQYGPSATWGDTIASIRSQLNTPRYCP